MYNVTPDPSYSKVCPRCDIEKVASEYHRTKYTKDGLGWYCKSCRSDIDKANQPTDEVIDHCHDTNVVRGILCRKCNCALGLLDDDPDKVSALLEYINGGVLSNV